MAIKPFTKETERDFGIIITSKYGWRILNGKKNFHQGIDLAPTKNVNGNITLIATTDGIIENQTDQNGGKYTYIRGDNGEGHMNVHVKEFLKPSGVRVKIGDPIALMGKTGHATGVHTHFEVRRDHKYSSTHTDPEPFTYYEKPMDNPEWGETLKWAHNVLDKYKQDLIIDAETNPDGMMTNQKHLILMCRLVKYIQASPNV